MDTFAGRCRPLSVSLVAVVATLVLVSGATGASGAKDTGKSTTLPTWRTVYNWPNGDGYAGWHSTTTAPDDYGVQSALGGEYGLWLWPLGGHKTYTTNDVAEWTYTAPGTTRLTSATLTYAWSNKLLAHHCLDIGLRTSDGTVVSEQDVCSPPPQSPRTVTLSDPATDPTATVLFFAVRVDCGGASSCSKTIPSLDPLTNGAYARLLQADLTLVDDDQPMLTLGSDNVDTTDDVYSADVTATDAGSGIVKMSMSQVGGPSFAEADASCDPTHHTDALDARICPSSLSLTGTLDISGLADGTYQFEATAVDVAGNVGTLSWSVTIDHSTSDAPSLTDDQVAQVTQLATSDPHVQQILAGQTYTVGDVATWTNYGGSDIVGGELEIDFPSPTTISAQWPDFAYNDAQDTDPSYRTAVVGYTTSNVTSVHVFVDLNCSTVVGVRPDDEASLDDSTYTLVSGPTQPAPCGDPPSNKTWTRNVREISVGGDAFWNYDFHHKDITEDFSQNANDPINLIFWGAFALDKSQLQKYTFTPGGGTENAFLYLDGKGWVWSSDRGSKDRITCGSDTHYRLYGDPHDMPQPNAQLGYFYIGGAHHDIADIPGAFGIPGPCDWFGGSSATYGWYENAERHVARYFNSLFGFAAKIDARWLGNPEGTHTRRKGYWDGDHWRSNDGYATMIHACIDGSGEAAPCQ